MRVEDSSISREPHSNSTARANARWLSSRRKRDRKSVVEGKRVESGVRRSGKKKRMRGIKRKGKGFIVQFENVYGNTNPDRTEKLFSESEVNSVFYSADLGYKNYLFLGLTGREDWFSTLDPSSNSTFYPSVSASFIYSEVIDLPEWMSYGKFRAGWGNVGGALPDAYALNLSYTSPD